MAVELDVSVSLEESTLSTDRLDMSIVGGPAGPPTTMREACCHPSRLCTAFKGEFRAQNDRLRMFASARANHRWPLVFATSPWFPHTSPYLLIIKLVLAVVFTTVLVVSLAVEFDDGFWFIYLTHWSFFIESAYFWSSAYTVYRGRQLVIDADGGPVRGGRGLPWYVRLSWALAHVEMPASLLVMGMYWTLVNPVWHIQSTPDFFGYFMHFINFFLCLGDLLVSRNVFYLRHVSWFLGYSALYLFFSLIHFWAKIGTYGPCTSKDPFDPHGPTYPRNECPVYAVLDWHHPTVTTVLVVILAFVVVPLAQFPVWWCVQRRRSIDCVMRTGP